MSDGITEAYKNVQTLTHDHKQETPYTKQIWAYLEKVEADNAALRLKVQGLDRTLADVYAQRDGLQRDLTTLETLVKALPKIKGTIFETVASCRGEGGPESWVRFEVALAALLTHRQGMGG